MTPSKSAIAAEIYYKMSNILLNNRKSGQTPPIRPEILNQIEAIIDKYFPPAPTDSGAEAAAKEIVDVYDKALTILLTEEGNTELPDDETIKAIIDSHKSPIERAAGKMLEALKRQKAAWILVYDALSNDPTSDMDFLESISPIKQIDAAIAEAEPEGEKDE